MRPIAVALALLAAQATVPASASTGKGHGAPLAKPVTADLAATIAEGSMLVAYEDLATSGSVKDPGTLASDQREWTKRRDAACAGSRGRTASCLAAFDKLRARDLKGMPASGPGTGKPMVPVLRWMGGSDGTLSWNAFLFRFADAVTPAEKAFDAWVAKRMDHVPRNVGIDVGVTGSFVQRGTISYASADLVSIRVDAVETVEGDPDGRSWTENVNFDLRKGVPVTAAATLTPEGLAVLRDTCLAQVAEHVLAGRSKAEAEAGVDPAVSRRLRMAEARSDVDAVTVDPAHWEFGPDALTVTYDVDTIAKHAEGASACTVGYETLRALAKPDATIPPVANGPVVGG